MPSFLKTFENPQGKNLSNIEHRHGVQGETLASKKQAKMETIVPDEKTEKLEDSYIIAQDDSGEVYSDE